jgi:hypothetical protein
MAEYIPPAKDGVVAKLVQISERERREFPGVESVIIQMRDGRRLIFQGTAFVSAEWHEQWDVICGHPRGYTLDGKFIFAFTEWHWE